ncbi:TIR domain protein [uncultured archaeon]|nr:TIR domain protein [uncultured archaeon]
MEIFTGIKSLKVFFSYSTNDKAIVGTLKNLLESMGFEVFLAHEDLEPCVEWREEIKENLHNCDIFIPLLTDNFKDSEWTDQETGMAVSADKFIIPIQVDFPPYGFIGKIQSLRKNEYPIETAKEIVKVIRKRSKFGKDMNNLIIHAFMNSKSFDQANDRARLLEDIPDLTPEQIYQLVNSTKKNYIIQKAYVAKRVLRPLFAKYKSIIKDEEHKELVELLR